SPPSTTRRWPRAPPTCAASAGGRRGCAVTPSGTRRGRRGRRGRRRPGAPSWSRASSAPPAAPPPRATGRPGGPPPGGAADRGAVGARGRGLPVVVGLGEPVLELAEGGLVAVDGTAGLVVAEPDPARVGAARAAAGARRRARSAAALARALPAVTRDG